MNSIMVWTPGDVVGLGVLLAIVACAVIAGLAEAIKLYWGRRK